MSFHRLRLCVALLSASLGACSGSLITAVDAPPAAPPGQGWLRFQVSPAQAEIYLDDRFMGLVVGWPSGLVRAPLGAHRLELRAAGHYSWYTIAQVTEQPLVVEVQLVPEPRDLADTSSAAAAP